MYQHTVLIYNPYAGALRRDPSYLDRAVAALGAQPPWRNARITTRPTRGPNTAGKVAQEALAGDTDLIVVAGGDGTINEVVNGIACSEVPLATIPAGTANVLASELGLGRKLGQAVRALASATPERVSLGLLRNPDPRYFLLMAGLGFDAQIVYQLTPQMKHRWGKLAYWMAGFRAVGRSLSEFDSLVDGLALRSSFALATRVRNYGGDIEIARSVSLLAPDFEFVLFAGTNSVRYLKYFAGIATDRLRGMSGVHVLRAREGRFDCPSDARIFAQVDGEFIGGLPATIETVPGALTVLIPPAYRARVAADLPTDSQWITSPTR